MLAREKWQIDTINVLDEVFNERTRQVKQYGHNDDFENGTGPEAQWVSVLDAGDVSAREVEETLRHDYESYEKQNGHPTWMHLVREEVAEAFMEDDPARLEEELIQVAALCVSWIETLRKQGDGSELL